MSGLKYFCYYLVPKPNHVSPYIGEWIEITYPVGIVLTILVSPYIGEWIEILVLSLCSCTIYVSPYIGEWIEIQVSELKNDLVTSHLT